MSKRVIEINEAIRQLTSFKNDPAYAKDAYAIDENVGFLKSIKNPACYFWWLLNRPKKIAPDRLLELTDFPVEEWDIKMHRRLTQMERNPHVAIGKPLADDILSFVSGAARPVVAVNLGAGAMEVDRQVIAALLEKKYARPLIMIGVDRSSATAALAKENIGALGSVVRLIECDRLTAERLSEIKAGNQGIVVILCKNDIFSLENDFPPGAFDLIYHSLFKHHLAPSLRPRLDALMKKMAARAVEYDGYRTWGPIVPQTIVAWNYPFFLGGIIFSNIRFDTASVVKARALPGKALAFYPKTGHYLLEL